MANPSVTYTFVNGNVADAIQVNQNFTDLINSLTDGTKTLNIDALTCAGAFTANGNVDLGNAAGDTVSITGTIDTDVTIKSTDTGATAGPSLILDRDSASAADSDAIGRIIFRGNDDAGTPADNDYASIEATIVDSGAGSEDGKLDFKVCVAGTPTSYITVESTKGVAIKGRLDGGAVSAGYVGQIVSGTLNGNTYTLGSASNAGYVDLPTAGIWMIYGGICFDWNTQPTVTSFQVGLSETQDTLETGRTHNYSMAIATSTTVPMILPSLPLYFVAAAADTIHLVGKVVGTGGGTLRYTAASGYLFAVRIC
jgi:hypothetical protein